MDEEYEPYSPLRDRNLNAVEPVDAYVQRMQAGPLPNWPEELLVEWLHRHSECHFYYSNLGFERLVFTFEAWPLEQIPGREAFSDPKFCDSFSGIEHRASPRDWLAWHMMEHGTWNTPIVLFRNEDGRAVDYRGDLLKSPYHLLEGHRRLSFLNGLRRLGKANPEHLVWVASL